MTQPTPRKKVPDKMDIFWEEARKSYAEASNAHLEEHHFTKPEFIKCKWCGSDDIIKHGVKNGVQEYLCQKCKREFNALDAPYGMRTTIVQIGDSLDLYYRGSSLTDIASHLKTTYDNIVERSTIYRWLVKFTEKAIELFDPIHPNVGDVWIADETVIKFSDVNHWVFDIIDRDSRFLLASYMSQNRGTAQAKILMELASERAGKIPQKIITDSLRAYLDGIELTFGSYTRHIQSSPFASEDSTNRIERMQATIKERTKVLWGFKTPDSAKLILSGFLIHYNYFRPHLALNGKTPAEFAGVKAPVKNWIELVRITGGIL